MGIHGGAKDYITTTFINCDNSGITRVSISKYRDKTVAIVAHNKKMAKTSKVDN